MIKKDKLFKLEKVKGKLSKFKGVISNFKVISAIFSILTTMAIIILFYLFYKLFTSKIYALNIPPYIIELIFAVLSLILCIFLILEYIYLNRHFSGNITLNLAVPLVMYLFSLSMFEIFTGIVLMLIFIFPMPNAPNTCEITLEFIKTIIMILFFSIGMIYSEYTHITSYNPNHMLKDKGGSAKNEE